MTRIALVLLASTVIFASAYTKEDRVKDMQDMERSMSTIEAGILYNKSKTVKKGTKSLSSEIRRVQAPLKEIDKQDPMHKYLNQKILCTNKIVKDIDEKSQIVLERFVAGDSRAATQAYTHIMKQCIQCHQEVHKW